MRTRLLILGLLTLAPFARGQSCSGGNCTASSCSTSDVQACINSTSAGHTCSIPAGTCTWTGGVSASGINIVGAGSPRYIAIVVNQALTLSTGSQSMTLTNDDPGLSAIPITVGQTLKLIEHGTYTNNMQGTVTAWNSSTNALTITITSATGSCGANSQSNCKRWLVDTVPGTYTALVDNNPGTGAVGPLFNLTENATYETTISNIWFQQGTDMDNLVIFNYGAALGYQPIIAHDCQVDQNSNGTQPPSGNGTAFYINTIHGLVYNCSFADFPWATAAGFISVQDDANFSGNSWTSVSNMGSAGNGSFEFYAEDNDYHGTNYATSTDENARAAWRYSMYDNSGVGTHGADTGPFGQRYFEFYNNVGAFEGYNDGTTFPMNDWFYLRGGTAIIYNNTLPALSSTDYGTKADVNMTVMNLQRNAGPMPCFGTGYTNGHFYFAPRQVGYGYVTGTGSGAHWPFTSSLGYTVPNTTGPDTYSAAAYGAGNQYVGDLEPLYIWSNSRNPLNDQTSDYGGSDCTSMTPDSTANYIVAGRDYYDNGTARPGWSAYTYPDPLRGTGYTMTWTVVGSGYLSGTDCSAGNYSGTIGPCTANPNTGYSFTGWSGVSGSATCSGATNPCPSFSIAATSAATATFTVSSYTLSTATAGAGTGTVTGCAGTLNYGAGYSCTVTPGTGSSITSVSGCGGSGTSTYTGTMPASNCTVTATFGLNSYTLSTAAAGTGSGTITGCAGSHNYGATYTCTVTPAGGSTLSSVTGCGGSGSTSYTGTMPASACTVTATFTLASGTPASPVLLLSVQ